ncbi:MAG: DedA family protein [Deltaproteobacteria bacterium]|uniref:DedA family protein n=1 Tax=Candidatus Zymogenus saltonus TaxID=2844893 RepID=A0A9D8KGS0_9DELT|nr:DedA family protein [Candidatus Zymogenus saltonus]
MAGLNFIFDLARKSYDWVLHWAETPYAAWALFILAFAESSFFPIPPDVLLIAMAISMPKRSFYFALICSVASVLGGALGYLIGLKFMEVIGFSIIDFYGYHEQFFKLQSLFKQYDVWVVGMAGFTPIPYKVFTIASGACDLNFVKFLAASIVSRSARFFLVGTMIYIFGEPVKSFIDKYFNLLTILFFVLIALGFLVIKYLF